MTSSWKLLAPKASYSDGRWEVLVSAKAPTTRPAPILECSCRNRCHCHTNYISDLARWRDETIERNGHGFGSTLLEAIEQAYVDLSEKIK